MGVVYERSDVECANYEWNRRARIKFDIIRQQQKRHDKRVTTETGHTVSMKATTVTEKVQRGSVETGELL